MDDIRAPACIVVGTGPAGLAAALALATVGAEVALAGPPPATGRPETRTAALFAGSIDFLRNIGAWEAAASHAAPLAAIRVVDDTGGLLRAPEVVFAAADAGRETLGANVPDAALAEALWRTAGRHPRIRIAATQAVVEVSIGEEAVRVRTHEGAEHAAAFLAAADGRHSICRQAAGIGVRTWAYDQAAIAATFAHGRPHRGVATEFHRPAGPLTTVPMPGDASSLVWVERAAIARRLAALDDDGFAAALAARLQGLLGRVGPAGPRRLFPLSAMVADCLGRNRVALVGEAAHVMPPIGAQGLNLSFRDAAALAQCWAEAASRDGPGRGGAAGTAALLARYHETRLADVASRSLAVDALNRSLLSELLPVALARGFGLHALAAIPPLRRALVRQGLGAAGPRLALLEPGGGGLIAARGGDGRRAASPPLTPGACGP
jgi:2-octaprenyl-6-methoxyphenol hydroxylase